MPTNETRCNRDIPKAVKRRAGRGIWCNERTRIGLFLFIFPTEPRGDVGNGSGATAARTVRHTRDFRHETDLALFARHTVSPIEHHPSTCRHPLPTPANMSLSVPKGIPSFDGTIRGDLRPIPYRFNSDSRSNWATLSRVTTHFLNGWPHPPSYRSFPGRRVPLIFIVSMPKRGTARFPTCSPVIGSSSLIFPQSAFLGSCLLILHSAEKHIDAKYNVPWPAD
ncbi:hypothetical protein EDB89DRAFT_1631921 [Lactarius sanguifluus]|nr:hypothetical protein EDB89DRAFT_1631921 [Lactarius sanguifluus]